MKDTTVLQVFALTGLGHLREAKSIKRALDKADIENDFLDILKWADEYSLITKITVLPLKFFKWFFEVTTRNSSALNTYEPPKFLLGLIQLFFRLAEVPLGFSLRKYLKECKYNTFIAVHPWALGAIWSFGLGRDICSNMINVIPDEIDVGSAPFYGIPGGQRGPFHMVNSERVSELIKSVGVKEDRIKIIGHTLDPLIIDKKEDIYNRVQAHLSDPNHKLTLGLFIGGTGTIDEQERIKEVIKNCAEEIRAGEIKIKAIPGPHLKFATDIIQILRDLNLENSPNIEVFSSQDRNYVIDKGHEWLAYDIDVLFAKTGEIIFYSLGSGIPHINFPPKGANEVFHLKYMQKIDAIHAYDSINNLREFLNNRERLKQISTNAFKADYRLHGAYEIVNFINETQI